MPPCVASSVARVSRRMEPGVVTRTLLMRSWCMRWRCSCSVSTASLAEKARRSLGCTRLGVVGRKAAKGLCAACAPVMSGDTPTRRCGEPCPGDSARRGDVGEGSASVCSTPGTLSTAPRGGERSRGCAREATNSCARARVSAAMRRSCGCTVE